MFTPDKIVIILDVQTIHISIVTAICLAFTWLAVGLLRPPADSSDRVRAISSPRVTLLPYITAKQNASMAYPSNIMPGARDVLTPFGSMRVNEWGPLNGRRVVLIHGSVTPSPMWANIAHGLVRRGCRVLTLDLWGRGYSDTPLDCPLEGRYFSLQIIFAIISSQVAWSQRQGISVVGYSLGGGIAVDFAATYPNLVESLVLLAPCGLMRHLPPGYESILARYPYLAPSKRFLRDLVMKLLEIELPDNEKISQSKLPMSRSDVVPPDESRWTPPKLDMTALLQRQVEHHDGFVKSFFDTTAHAPVRHQDRIYSRACSIITSKEETSSRLCGSPILVLLGKRDTVIPPEEYRVDLLKFLPTSYAKIITLPGDHTFPFSEGELVLEHISRLWNLKIPPTARGLKQLGDSNAFPDAVGISTAWVA